MRSPWFPTTTSIRPIRHPCLPAARCPRPDSPGSARIAGPSVPSRIRPRLTCAPRAAMRSRRKSSGPIVSSPGSNPTPGRSRRLLRRLPIRNLPAVGLPPRHSRRHRLHPRRRRPDVSPRLGAVGSSSSGGGWLSKPSTRSSAIERGISGGGSPRRASRRSPAIGSRLLATPRCRVPG